jgi:hypothetical protein
MSRLALFLLSPPRIEHDGVLVDVDTRKARLADLHHDQGPGTQTG